MSYRKLQLDQQSVPQPPKKGGSAMGGGRKSAGNPVAPQQWSPARKATGKKSAVFWPTDSTPRPPKNTTNLSGR